MSHVRSLIILVTLKSFWNKFDASYTLFGGLTYYDIKREIVWDLIGGQFYFSVIVV